MATTPEKEEVKPTATTENPIPKEEPATTSVTTPDSSNKVTTPDDSSKTSTDSKNTTSNTTSNTGGNTNTGTKSGNTSGSGSTGSNKGGTSSGSTSGGTTTTPTNPTPAPTPTPPPTPTPQPPKYTPSYTLREDLANEIFNAVSKYRQDNGLGALTRISSYNTTAQNYLSYRIDGQPKPDLNPVYAHYATQEGDWSAEALAGVIGRADRWQGGNTVSVKVAQKGEDYYICFAIKK